MGSTSLSRFWVWWGLVWHGMFCVFALKMVVLFCGFWVCACCFVLIMICVVLDFVVLCRVILELVMGLWVNCSL